MEFEDSRFALFPEPNAFIQKFNNDKQREPKKVVFSEPYESLPAFCIKNNFKKETCDCVKKINNNKNSNNEQTKNGKNKCDYECSNRNNQTHIHDNCNQLGSSKQSGFGFDLKSLLPLLSLFNKGGGADLSQIVGLLNKENSQPGNDLNPMNLISSILSNKEVMSGILNLFKGGGLNLFKKQQTKKELKTTDFEIKNYTRVE